MACKDLKFKLISGNVMPLIGFGTFQIRGGDLIHKVLDMALRAGYRQFDTAAVYGNETDIGVALKELLPKYKLTRKDIFITSKLSPSNQGECALNALGKSLQNLNCDYLDLYLIHWPGSSNTPSHHPDNAKNRLASWSSLVKGVKTGLVKDIGVSNYTIQHMNELLAQDFGIKPAVNQVEWHPHCHESDLKELCENEGILLQAYSSLGGSNNPKLISDPVITEIANKLKQSPAQLLLRWALQQNIGIIPKARSWEHIEANINLDFVIPDQDMNTINNLKTKGERYAWNPKVVS